MSASPFWESLPHARSRGKGRRGTEREGEGVGRDAWIRGGKEKKRRKGEKRKKS